jgi:D-alanyl-D-alanine carboxypeptidase (penicillin-binding protein 5/6)
MKKSLLTSFVAAGAVFCFFFAAGAVDAREKAGRHQAKAEKTEAEAAKAYVVMDPVSGRVLEEQNMHERRPPASMTKLMVAYIVLDKLSKGEIHLTDMVPVTREASKIGGSQVYLKEGEAFTLEDMMRAVMIASANDGAYAVAEFIGGTAKSFVGLMNEQAKALGMADTEFSSVHGLPPSKDQKEDLTSCYDMAVLARAILKYPKIIEWTSTKTGEFRNGTFILNNHNKLLSRMAEVDGLKTGFYRSTGYNVTATAHKGDLRFIVVVMGSPTSRARDDLALEKLKTYFAEYTVINLAKKGEPVEKEVVLQDGKYRKLKGVAAADFNLPVLRGRKKEIKRVFNMPERVKGEVREGQKLGELIFQMDNETVGKVDIVSPVYVPKANLFTRIVRRTGLNL